MNICLNCCGFEFQVPFEEFPFRLPADLESGIPPLQVSDVVVVVQEGISSRLASRGGGSAGGSKSRPGGGTAKVKQAIS